MCICGKYQLITDDQCTYMRYKGEFIDIATSTSPQSILTLTELASNLLKGNRLTHKPNNVLISTFW